MPYEHLLSGLLELHVLYHAAQEEIFGLGWLEEFKRHGYRISPGTLYPLLHRLTHRDYLRVRELELGRTRRRLYRATLKGRRPLAVVRYHVRELVGELDESPGTRIPTPKAGTCERTRQIMSDTSSGRTSDGSNQRAWLFDTRARGWSILIRLLVGLVVFLPEGIQKLALPEILGSGRFAHIGIPYPDVMGPFVGIVEIVCGTLIILGFLTRLASIPLIIIMIVAIVSTKVPILLGQDFWIFHVTKLPHYGLWSMLHEARLDFCMLLGALYLLIEGAGAWSVDARLSHGSVLSRSPKD
jgi:putative oxidoreductase